MPYDNLLKTLGRSRRQTLTARHWLEMPCGCDCILCHLLPNDRVPERSIAELCANYEPLQSKLQELDMSPAELAVVCDEIPRLSTAARDNMDHRTLMDRRFSQLVLWLESRVEAAVRARNAALTAEYTFRNALEAQRARAEASVVGYKPALWEALQKLGGQLTTEASRQTLLEIAHDLADDAVACRPTPGQVSA